MKYYGTFSANGGTTYSGEPYEFTSKAEANSTMREIAMSNTFSGNNCNWEVTDESGKTVYSGSYMPGIGVRYAIKNYINAY